MVMCMLILLNRKLMVPTFYLKNKFLTLLWKYWGFFIMVTIKMLFFATLSTVTLGKNSFVNLYRIIILSSTAHQVSSQTDCSSLQRCFSLLPTTLGITIRTKKILKVMKIITFHYTLRELVNFALKLLGIVMHSKVLT